MPWTVETLNDTVDSELGALPADMRARFVHISHLFEEFGIERIREPHVKHLRGPLWEMRMKGKDGISRAIYVDGSRSAHRGRASLHQENPGDTKPRDRTGAETRKGGAGMSKVKDLHRKWLKDGKYRRVYEALAPEFELARAVIRARAQANLTQEELAERMDTTQSVIARLESGRARPSTQTLERLAAATGTRLKISFEPKRAA
jgi:ribosome-binding protein aMBF1 (putative translation factor)